MFIYFTIIVMFRMVWFQLFWRFDGIWRPPRCNNFKSCPSSVFCFSNLFFMINTDPYQYLSCSFLLRRRIWQLHWSGTEFFHCILWIHAAHIWFQQLIGLLVSLRYAYQRLHHSPVFIISSSHRTCWIKVKACNLYIPVHYIRGFLILFCIPVGLEH